jgi:integrase
LVTELQALRERQREQQRRLGDRHHDYGLVFCQPNGKPLHAHNIVRRDFRRVLALEGLRDEMRKQGVREEALPKGLPRIRFHDLRHSFATRHLARGVHPKVVAGLLGHASVQVTLDTYSAVIPALAEEAVYGMAAEVVTGAGA